MTSVLNLQSPPSAAAPHGRLRFEWATSLEDVDALEIAWRQLGHQCEHPLAQFSWTRAAVCSFASDGAPRVLALGESDQLAAIAPLVQKRSRGVHRLYLAGVGQLHEPTDFVWRDEAALDRLITALTRVGRPLVLERLPADSLSVKKIHDAARGRAIIVARPQATCPYIALDQTWLEPEQHLNSGRRSDLRRARRKAEQAGGVSTEIHTPDLDSLPHMLDVAFEVEARSWKGDEGTALAHDGPRAVFYRQYAEAACVEGILRICFLRIGDRVAAMQLAIEQGGGFWLLKVGYDARFASCSPGLLLMRDTIRYAAEAGLKTYEFLGKAESWTEVWTRTEHPTVALRIYPLNIRGLAALTADGIAALRARWRKP